MNARLLTAVIGVLCVIGGIALISFHSNIGAVIQLLASGIVLLIAAFFEKSRYKPDSTLDSTDSTVTTDWTETNERFIDDVSGKQMAVWYNAKTGQRDYRETDPPKKRT